MRGDVLISLLGMADWTSHILSQALAREKLDVAGQGAEVMLGGGCRTVHCLAVYALVPLETVSLHPV